MNRGLRFVIHLLHYILPRKKVGLAVLAFAQEHITTDIGTIDVKEAAKAFKKPGYLPYAGRNFPTRVFCGHTHIHTGWSADAGAFGATLGPEEAFRFARGEEKATLASA